MLIDFLLPICDATVLCTVVKYLPCKYLLTEKREKICFHSSSYISENIQGVSENFAGYFGYDFHALKGEETWIKIDSDTVVQELNLMQDTSSACCRTQTFPDTCTHELFVLCFDTRISPRMFYPSFLIRRLYLLPSTRTCLPNDG